MSNFLLRLKALITADLPPNWRERMDQIERMYVRNLPMEPVRKVPPPPTERDRVDAVRRKV